MKTIITIGRQFGSGGHEIAKTLSQTLDIPLYDKELITEAAKKSGLHENLFKNAEERDSFSFLYSVATGAYSVASGMGGSGLIDVHDSVFHAQADAISEFAKRGPCVFVGRAADYVLGDWPNCLRIFIHGDLHVRTERISRLYGLGPKEAGALIQKTDKKRANFYQYYTGQKWSNLQNYDLCLNSSKLGVAGCADTILTYLKQMEATACGMD